MRVTEFANNKQIDNVPRMIIWVRIIVRFKIVENNNRNMMVRVEFYYE